MNLYRVEKISFYLRTGGNPSPKFQNRHPRKTNFDKILQEEIKKITKENVIDIKI